MKDPYSLFEKFTLENGLTVWHLYEERAFACFEFVVHAGSREDPSGKEGLAHFNEHLVSRNTPGYPDYSKNKKWFEDTGGQAAFGSTSFFATTYDFKVAFEHIPKALDIFGSMLVRSTAEVGIEKERAVIQREYLRRYPTVLSFEVACFGYRDFFPNHRTTHSTPLGTPETISAITQEDLRGFLERYYCPQNMTIVCVGGITVEELKGLLTTSPFSDENKGSANSNRKMVFDPVIPENRLKTVRLSDHTSQPINQSSVKRIIALPAKTDEQVIRGLASVIEDELYEEIRERKSLTYQISVRPRYSEGIKGLEIETAVPIGKAEEVDRLITQCIKGLFSKKADFETQKKLSLDKFKLRDQTLRQTAENASWDIIYHNRIITAEEEKLEIQSLTWSMFEEAITDILDENRNMTLLVIP